MEPKVVTDVDDATLKVKASLLISLAHWSSSALFFRKRCNRPRTRIANDRVMTMKTPMKTKVKTVRREEMFVSWDFRWRDQGQITRWRRRGTDWCGRSEETRGNEGERRRRRGRRRWGRKWRLSRSDQEMITIVVFLSLTPSSSLLDYLKETRDDTIEGLWTRVKAWMYARFSSSLTIDRSNDDSNRWKNRSRRGLLSWSVPSSIDFIQATFSRSDAATINRLTSIRRASVTTDWFNVAKRSSTRQACCSIWSHWAVSRRRRSVRRATRVVNSVIDDRAECRERNEWVMSRCFLGWRWIRCTLTDHGRIQSTGRSCDGLIVVVLRREEERKIEEEKGDGQLAVNVDSAFFFRSLSLSSKGTSSSTEMTCRLYWQ